MTKYLNLILSCAFISSAQVFAEDLSSPTDPLPSGTFTGQPHSDEWKIKNALSAGPSWISEKATVIEMDAHMNMKTLRNGTNGWTCMPDTPGRPQHDPMCLDETTMQWLMAVMAGNKPNITHVGLSYMLLGEARQGQNVPTAKDPSTAKDWYYIGPHVMIVLPDENMDALKGINQDLSKDGQYITSLNHSPSLLWVIPVARGGERIKAYQPESEQK